MNDERSDIFIYWLKIQTNPLLACSIIVITQQSAQSMNDGHQIQEPVDLL